VRIFVTGTDTGVGKTFVSTALLRAGRARGWDVVGWKPIETGCTPVAADARALSEAGGRALAPSYAFAMPAAPAVAAAREGVMIDVDAIVERARALTGDLVIVEGAGGWRVPITDDVDMGELARRVGWPVLIVGRAALGTINHTLLTLEAVADGGCSIHGVVLSVLPTDDHDFARSNRDEIAKRTTAPVWLDPIDALGPAR
jgi:dethiobiotin synthetase